MVFLRSPPIHIEARPAAEKTASKTYLELNFQASLVSGSYRGWLWFFYRYLLPDFIAPRLTFGDHLVRQVVLVDVAHVLNGFSSDLGRGDDFDIVEPQVRIIAALRGLSAQFMDLGRSRVVGSESE